MFSDFVIESVSVGMLYAFASVLVSVLVAGILRFVITTVIIRKILRDERRLIVDMFRAAREPSSLFVITLGLLSGYMSLSNIGSPVFDSIDSSEEWAVRIWLAAVAIDVGYLASNVLNAMTRWYIRHISDRTTTNMIEKLLPQLIHVTPIVIFSVAVIMALDILGVSVAPLVAGLGIGGIAVALAIQPTLGNFLSGVYLITEGDLNEGDFIELDKGPSGFVVDVGWRSTKIQDRHNNRILIPNSKMIDSIMTNFHSESSVVTVFTKCGISYESDLDLVERTALEVATSVRDDLEEAEDDYEPLIYFTDFGDSNIDFLLLLQARDRPGSFVVKHELIKRLRVRFNQENVEINYPVRKIVRPNDGNHVDEEMQ